MTIKLGYVGVEDTMAFITSIIRQNGEFECLPFAHERFEDIGPIVTANAEKVDMWLFSGPLPYRAAREQAPGITKPMFYISYSGAGLYRTLCQLFYRERVDMSRLSFDMYGPKELAKVAEELGLTGAALNGKPFDGSYQALIDYHADLWRRGAIDYAVTCVWYVQDKLKALGVPVLRVIPTEASVQAALAEASRTWETLRYMDAQIAVQLVETDPYAGLTRDTFGSDELFRLELTVSESLLDYSRRLQGSLKTISPGRYAIFTTRGILKDVTRGFEQIPEGPELSGLGAELTCGIGIGRTAYEAELLAGKALMQTRQCGKGAWMVAFDDKTITGPLGRTEQLSYSYSAEGLQTVSERTGLSTATLGKIEAVLRKTRTDVLTSTQLAQQMMIMPRSARRILIQLETSGFAEVTGEETAGARGRPLKLYRITLRRAD
ncbi:ArsR family transcriptional regulator [Paenibacillus rhizovicinus]|uniref:ArsR family transcriptional regulator n=1 Tax=Paenibacillus rhizovicinus TaxID=2704463 RepID=A0A6C0P0C3_9BACL|nr:ArsR family transcriptional regulator [Paenibacillus rhizovicinus]QHW31831.1 ArsR family transcriptional regulator [Paenibacillus rhizovicinus]